MGGGAAMRAAAKVAGAGVLNGGIRGGESPVAAAARKATRSVASVVSSTDSGDLKVAVANSNDGKVNSTVHKPYADMNDWEFTELEDELVMPLPRLVFGCAPTIQEAKQATSELNDALEIAYLSPSNTNRLKDSSDSETKPCLVSETAVTHSAPKHALQAFKLLHENAVAQNVVASIASDPNVWGAVMQNEELVNFLQSHKTSEPLPDADPNLNDSFTCNEIPEAAKKSEEGEKGFMDYVVEVKQSVVEMMNGLSDYFQSLFGGPAKENYSVNGDGISVEKATIGASLMGLAIMVIMVVVLKRPA